MLTKPQRADQRWANLIENQVRDSKGLLSESQVDKRQFLINQKIIFRSPALSQLPRRGRCPPDFCPWAFETPPRASEVAA